jgi:tRNA A37 threonylcarbamoyltransferase TsaD
VLKNKAEWHFNATVDEAIREAGIQPQQLSAVAVTIGPGLSLCLQVRWFAWMRLCDFAIVSWIPI